MPWTVRLKMAPGPGSVEHTITDQGEWAWSEIPPALRPAVLAELTGRVMDLVRTLEHLGWVSIEIEKP